MRKPRFATNAQNQKTLASLWSAKKGPGRSSASSHCFKPGKARFKGPVSEAKGFPGLTRPKRALALATMMADFGVQGGSSQGPVGELDLLCLRPGFGVHLGSTQGPVSAVDCPTLRE